MNSIGKWKIATYTLALTTAGAFWYGRGGTNEPGATATSVRDASYDKRLSSLSRLRLPASMAGIDEDQLLRDLRGAHSLHEITLLCERLGVFGTDRALPDLEALSVRRKDAAGVAILAMGGIGTDQATDRLIRMAGAGRNSTMHWAVRALAKTGNDRAHGQIFEWAQGAPRGLQLGAIQALGTIGGDKAMDILTTLAVGSDRERLYAVLDSAGRIGTAEAVGLIQTIADRGNRNLRMSALRLMPRDLEEAQQEWLMNILSGTDQQCAALAAEALGRAQARDAMPLLLDAARSGNRVLQGGAIRALSALGGDEARQAIGELFANAKPTNAYELGRALLDMGGDEGQAIFLAAMHKGHPARAELLGLLQEFPSDSVQALRVEILKSGSRRERDAVMYQLMGSDDPEVASIMLNLAKTGNRNDRYTALNYLSQNSSEEAQQAILEMAQGRGQASVEALRILGEHRASDPEAQGLLIEALYSGVPDKAQSASWALANSGSEEARSALLSALESDSPMLANAAMGALGQLGEGPEVTEALQRIVGKTDNPQLKASALYQLSRSGDPESTALVVKAISDGDPMASSLVSELLQRGGADAENVIEVASTSDSPQTRAALANALTHGYGGKDAAGLLDTLSRDKDPTVQSAAVYALANQGGTKAADRLLELASTGDAQVRATAISALGNSGDARAGKVIADAIGSGDTSLAQSAIYSARSGGPEVDEALLALIDNSEGELFLRQQAANVLLDRGGVDPSRREELKKLSGQNGSGSHEGPD